MCIRDRLDGAACRSPGKHARSSASHSRRAFLSPAGLPPSSCSALIVRSTCCACTATPRPSDSKPKGHHCPSVPPLEQNSSAGPLRSGNGLTGVQPRPSSSVTTRLHAAASRAISLPLRRRASAHGRKA
eukprot:5465236-Prymnesium_polylepis.1